MSQSFQPTFSIQGNNGIVTFTSDCSCEAQALQGGSFTYLLTISGNIIVSEYPSGTLGNFIIGGLPFTASQNSYINIGIDNGSSHISVGGQISFGTNTIVGNSFIYAPGDSYYLNFSFLLNL